MCIKQGGEKGKKETEHNADFQKLKLDSNDISP